MSMEFSGKLRLRPGGYDNAVSVDVTWPTSQTPAATVVVGVHVTGMMLIDEPGAAEDTYSIAIRVGDGDDPNGFVVHWPHPAVDGVIDARYNVPVSGNVGDSKSLLVFVGTTRIAHTQVAIHDYS